MKRIPITPEISNHMRRSYGPDANLSSMVVYEVVMANMNGVRKKGLYEGARLLDNTLNEMVAAVNAESIPFLHSHNSEVLALGRVFFAARNGSEARGLVAVSSEEHPEMIAKMDSGTLDQVSIGLLPQRLTCSSCGFDYLGADATWENVMMRTCPNNHVVGENDVHLKIDGVDMFYELSAVNQGGLQGARILGSADSMFARLAAASGRDAGVLGAFVLQCSADPTPEEEAAAAAAADAEAAAAAEAEAAAAPAPTPASAGQGELFAAALHTMTEKMVALSLQTTGAEERARQHEARVATLQAEIAKLRPQIEGAQKALLSIAKKTQIALSGKTTVEDTASIDILLQTIEDGQTKLGSVFPIGGAAKSAQHQMVPTNKTTAFTTSRT